MTREYACQGNSRDDQRDGEQSPGTGFDAVVPNPKLKLMDQVREVMRLRHYSLSTERSYCDWIRRYIKFHQMRCRADLDPGEPKIEAFLSELAVHGNVAVSTQNQAFNGLLFLYQQVLHQKLGNVQAIRATRPRRVPRRIYVPAAGRLICLTPWSASTSTRPVIGGGSTCSRLATSRWTRGQA